ncbi:tyrosine-type recombinase/integrase [Streptomyces aureus]|uniref:tyrosine-type recombinase/integrase n=1 Tax=Streptomyces aureus TaxID=193461 RepID=UPI0036783378
MAGVPAPIEDANRVFTKEDGSTYHPQFFSDRWDRLIEQSGLPPIRLHDGRHEAASLALAAGVAPKAVKAMLGHSSLRMTTDTYQTVLPGRAVSPPMVHQPSRGGRPRSTRAGAGQARYGNEGNCEGCVKARPA